MSAFKSYLPLYVMLTLGISLPLPAATPPALSNPSATPESPLGPEFHGALAGQASVSAGGNASYVLPIEVPPGTRGMAPQISLNYNSNMQNGLFGLGWFIQGPTSRITRCPQTVSQDGNAHTVDYSSEDRFCLDGHRLVLEAGAYGAVGAEYRTETNSFARIVSYGTAGTGPSYFVVETKEGLTKYYGNTSDSKIEAEGMTTVINWALNRVEDAAGNYYTVAYHEDNAEGEFYIIQIDYTGNDAASLNTNASVEFIYEARPDTPLRFQGGAQISAHPKRVANIKTYVDLALVSDYRMTYGLVGTRPSSAGSTTGMVSRLTQIERCNSLGICQAPLVLDWWADDIGASYSHYEIDIPADTNRRANQNAEPRWHDINGDGSPDYVYQKFTSWIPVTATGDFDVMLSGPTGYQAQTWTGGYTGNIYQMGDFYWADADGDGRTDIIRVDEDHDNYTVEVALSTGSGFSIQTWKTFSLSWNDPEISFRDMNGDKLLDMLVKEQRSENPDASYCAAYNTVSTSEDSRIHVFPNTGSSFGTQETWANLDNHMAHLVDMDGDGLTDLVEDAHKVHLNNGTSFNAPKVFPWTGGNNYCSSVTFYDYNNDGKTDRLRNSTDEVYYNTGDSFKKAGIIYATPSIDMTGDGYGDSYSRTIHSSNAGNFKKATVDIYPLGETDDFGVTGFFERIASNQSNMNGFGQAADIDGDGIYELTYQRTWLCVNYSGVFDDQWCEDDRIRIYKSDQTHHHLLKKITTGPGAEVLFAFAPLTDHSIYTKYDTSTLPELDVQDGTQVVTNISQPDGIGGTYSIDYKYEGLKRDLDGRGNLGFAKITAKNLSNGTTTITDYAQTFPYSSRPTKSEIKRTSDGRLLSRTETSYGQHGTVGSGTVFPYVSSRVTETFNLSDERPLSTSTTTNQVDMYGNITDSTEETVDHENGDIFKVQKLSTFNIDLSNWRVGELTSQTTKAWLNGSYNSALDRRTDFTYHPSTGFLKDTIQEPGKGAGIELTKTLAYDSFGNVLSETISGPGVTTRVTTMTYDLRGQFVLTLTNPLGHVVSRSWGAEFGTKLTETDANGQSASWTYNGFGQQVLAYRPDGTSTETRIYEDNSGTHPTAVLYLQVLSTGKAPVREFYDLLGRTVKTRSQGFDGSYINQDTEYDSQGRVERTSEPYYDGDGIDWNVNTFDFLGRVTAIAAADPVKSVTSAYDGFSVAITDAQSRTKTQTTNAAGQIIEVIDRMGTTMTFGYDPAGNRIQVTNAVGTAKQNSVTYSYDRLGRMLTQNDPDHGIYTYTYDALGQKLSEVSPKMAAASQSVTYQYDLLGRMTSRTEPEGTTTWTFDNIAGGNLGKGQLHSESSSGFSRTYAYAAGNYGRLTGTSTVIDSITFNTAMTYNSNGQVATETYPASVTSPGGFQVAYTYNALGFQERVQAPGGAAVYYQMLTADAAGRTTSEWLGDGSTANQVYEAASSRVVDQHTTNGGTDIQHFDYTYDDAGNMISRGDVRQGLSEAFTFDNLDRLTSGLVAGGTTATYAFDVVGNITEKSDAGNPYLYTTSKVHAVTEITVGGTTKNLSYDSNGNLSTGDDVPTITWSSYNKPTQLTKGAITYNFSYGPDRSRYKKVKGTDTTYYIGNGFERINKFNSTEYRHMIRANGKVVMMRKDFTAGVMNHQYVHRDHLGSVTALTKESDGSVIERYSYDAWGMRRNPTTWAPATITAYEQRGYTGHEHLDDIGIIHMNGRIYAPKLGRMVNPDPMTPAPENGQSFNRYTYVFNNPLKYSDPSGFLPNFGGGELGGPGSGTTTSGLDFSRRIFGIEYLLALVEVTEFNLFKLAGGKPQNFGAPKAQTGDSGEPTIIDQNPVGDGEQVEVVYEPTSPNSVYDREMGKYVPAEGQDTGYWAQATGGGNETFIKRNGETIPTPGLKTGTYIVSSTPNFANSFIIRNVPSTGAFVPSSDPGGYALAVYGQYNTTDTMGHPAAGFKPFRVHTISHGGLWNAILNQLYEQRIPRIGDKR
jgi:RHS repeat-associated protein